MEHQAADHHACHDINTRGPEAMSDPLFLRLPVRSTSDESMSYVSETLWSGHKQWRRSAAVAYPMLDAIIMLIDPLVPMNDKSVIMLGAGPVTQQYNIALTLNMNPTPFS